MRYKRLRANPAEVRPRTTIGFFLRANALDDQKTRDRFSSQLNGGQKGWNQDQPAVVQAACELPMTRLFERASHTSDVDHYVAELYSRWDVLPEPDRQGPVSQAVAVEVVRTALGESGDLTSLNPLDLMVIRTVSVAVACASMGMSATQVEQLIAAAERIAFRRGWSPPLAPTALESQTPPRRSADTDDIRRTAE